MIRKITKFLMVFAIVFSLQAQAEVDWKTYSPAVAKQAEKSGKTVILGFHKKGCGTCAVQDSVLKDAGINKLKYVETLRVERKDSDMDSVYKKYGFNKKQWAAMVMLKEGKEVARLQPGTTDKNQIQAFLAKAR